MFIVNGRKFLVLPECLFGSFDLMKNDKWRKDNNVRGMKHKDSKGIVTKFYIYNLTQLSELLCVKDGFKDIKSILCRYGFESKSYKVSGCVFNGYKLSNYSRAL